MRVDGDRIVDDASLARQWALAGRGITLKSALDVRQDEASGALVRLLPDWDTEPYPLHALLPSGRFVPARVRALVDFLAGKFAALPCPPLRSPHDCPCQPLLVPTHDARLRRARSGDDRGGAAAGRHRAARAAPAAGRRFDLVDGIVAAALPLLPAELPVLFLPTQQIGLSPEHARFAGTLTLSAETLIRLWNEIGAGVARAGVRKLVLFNAHGGHIGAMDIVARELRAAHGLIVYSVSWFNLPLGDAGAQFSADEHRFGVHAGEIETSMMLALAPGRCDGRGAAISARARSQRAADYPCSATAAAPSSAGPWRTTTRKARPATPLPRRRTRGRR